MAAITTVPQTCSPINGKFARFLYQVQFSILKIRHVFLRLKISPSLKSNNSAYFWTSTNTIYETAREGAAGRAIRESEDLP